MFTFLQNLIFFKLNFYIFSEFSTVIRFSTSTKEPGKKLKKTITQTRVVLMVS